MGSKRKIEVKEQVVATYNKYTIIYMKL